MIKNINKTTLKPYIGAGSICLTVFCFVFILVASGNVAAVSSDIAKWYSSDQPLSSGEIVSIDAQKGEYVVAANAKTSNKLLGVVVPEDEALVSIDKKSDGVQVAIAGRAQAKVNLSNGPISRGDLVGISDEDGIGSKALASQPVIGIAEASFGEENEKQSAKSGLIPVIVSVGVAPSALSSQGTSATWLKSIAGRDVSALQIAFVFFIAIVGLVSIVTLSYASIRNGVIATGRNPLAKPSILRALSQAMIMVSLIAISSFSLMYFMLRL